MKYYNLFDLRIQDLYVFVCTAEYRSITKAASYLYLTPSQVSKIIRKLEEYWGIQLFIRDKNLIHLTPAGKHIYEGMNHILGDIENVFEEAVAIQEVKPLIRIGCPSLSKPNELFVPVLEEYTREHPHTSVTIECRDTLYLLKKMLIGKEADLIYTADAEMAEHWDLIGWAEIEQLPLYVIMNREHPLAGREWLSVEDLKYQKFVLTKPISGEYTDYAVQLCARHGFSPRIARYVPNIYSQFMEVHINPDVVIIQTIKGFEHDERICYRQLPGISWKMGFAYRKDAAVHVREFVDCAVRCMGKQEG